MDDIRRLILNDPIQHAGVYDCPGQAWVEGENGPEKSSARYKDRAVVLYQGTWDDAEINRRLARLLHHVARKHPTVRVHPYQLVTAARRAFGRKEPLTGLLMSRETLLRYFRDRVQAERSWPWSLKRCWRDMFEAMASLVIAHNEEVPCGWVVATTLPENVGRFTCDGSWGCPWGMFVCKSGVRAFRLM